MIPNANVPTVDQVCTRAAFELTRYDRGREGKADYNRYALAAYLGVVQEARKAKTAEEARAMLMDGFCEDSRMHTLMRRL